MIPTRYFLEQLEDLYTEEEALVWLSSPQKLLGGETPAELIEQGRVDEVMTVIGQLQDGAFV